MLSDVIEQMLLEMLRDEGGSLELKRNDLAQRLGCVPSQINYVITSRFTPEKGYVIESRRGGGGYVRITKKVFHKDEYLMHLFCSVGDEIDQKTWNDIWTYNDVKVKYDDECKIPILLGNFYIKNGIKYLFRYPIGIS